MHNETHEILGLIVLDKREVEKKSPNMEKEGLRQAIDLLLGAKVKVVEVVTDGHLQIKAMMGMY